MIRNGASSSGRKCRLFSRVHYSVIDYRIAACNLRRLRATFPVFVKSARLRLDSLTGSRRKADSCRRRRIVPMKKIFRRCWPITGEEERVIVETERRFRSRSDFSIEIEIGSKAAPLARHCASLHSQRGSWRVDDDVGYRSSSSSVLCNSVFFFFLLSYRLTYLICHERFAYL